MGIQNNMKICGKELLLCIMPALLQMYSTTKLMLFNRFWVFLRFENSAWDFYVIYYFFTPVRSEIELSSGYYPIVFFLSLLY